jgi:hypothetical protein
MTEHDSSAFIALESDAADLRQQIAAERLAHTQTLAELGLAKNALASSEAERERLRANVLDLVGTINGMDETEFIAQMALDFVILRGGQVCHWLHIAGTTESREIAGELEGFLELLDEEGMLDDDDDDEAGGDAGKWETN